MINKTRLRKVCMKEIKTYLRNSLKEISIDDKSIVILKGFNVNEIVEDEIDIDLSKLINGSKLKYFSEIVETGRRYLSYEEYIYLFEFINTEFEKIIIVENNLFINFSPLTLQLEENIINGLQNHFDPDKDENAVINNIFNYTFIYSNFTSINGEIYITYNETPSLTIGDKIQTIKLFKEGTTLPDLIKIEETKLEFFNFLNIEDEEDYLLLVQKLTSTEEAIYVNYSSYTLDKNILEDKLKLINHNITSKIHLAQVYSEQKKEFKKSEEFTKILKKHWGKDSFRSLKIYDFESIKTGVKKIETTTQEYIINDIVEQVEMCMEKEDADYRDIFVTAPTGSGKSAMFQIPAIYLAEKYNLVTLVISPLIGLMVDQVGNLEKSDYSYARTINSDIPSIIKEEIINDIAESKCHILYLSPESLLSRSDVMQLIGDRKIGMIVIDEAHIVTTWGKQFRPDYWYLGDHIRKLRKKQREAHHPFVVATFTATAIYGGVEDMYQETINSLHLRRPITYLGYVKREDIEIKIKEVEVNRVRSEYELNKFDDLINIIMRAEYTGKKTLIYFPTVRLINTFYDYCYSKNLQKIVARYHGQLNPADKDENYKNYRGGIKLVMLATKAFGMGIDINDIEIVCHFAPTGNVCDYVQEIGRAARRPDLKGEAIYNHMSNDFQHINRLHGLSVLKEYQLVEVIKKIYELHKNKINSKTAMPFTKKRNEMLIDAESFAYIFESPLGDENDSINKVKTALLIIQKDYESKSSYAPFYMRPIPMFAKGFFMIDEINKQNLCSLYGKAILKVCDDSMQIYELDLKTIWEQSYEKDMSFPKFKFLLYTKSPDLEFNEKFKLKTALNVEVKLEDDSPYNKLMKAMGEVFRASAYNEQYLSLEEIAKLFQQKTKMSPYKMVTLTNVLLAAMDNYKRNFSNLTNSNMYKQKPLKDGSFKYRFNNPVNQFLEWIDKGSRYIQENINDGRLYLVDDGASDKFKEYITILGILEAMSILTFKTLGGANSQIYIYVNQTKTMQMVVEKPYLYKNKLLELVGERHKLSVEMLSYLYQNNFESTEIWDHIENYFLGIIPEKVKIKGKD